MPFAVERITRAQALSLVVLVAGAVTWAVVGFDRFRFGAPAAVRIVGACLVLVAILVVRASLAAGARLQRALAAGGPETWSDYAHGPYRYARHPMYVASPLASAGAGLLFGAWPFIVLIPVLLGANCWSAIKEERNYRTNPLYVEYALRTRAVGRRRQLPD